MAQIARLCRWPPPAAAARSGSRDHGGQSWACAHQNNEVDIGVRVEVPNAVMDHLTKHLYEAKLVYYSDTFENKVRTFCMNPGGVVSEEHYESGHGGGQRPQLRRRRPPHRQHQLCHAGVHPASPSPSTSPSNTASTSPSWATCSPAGGIMVQRLGDLLKGRRTDAGPAWPSPPPSPPCTPPCRGTSPSSCRTGI